MLFKVAQLHVAAVYFRNSMNVRPNTFNYMWVFKFGFEMNVGTCAECETDRRSLLSVPTEQVQLRLCPTKVPQACSAEAAASVVAVWSVFDSLFAVHQEMEGGKPSHFMKVN